MPAQAAMFPDPHLACEVAALRFRLALVKHALEARRMARLADTQRRPRHVKAGFDPAQPRDEQGRWSDTGASDLSAQRRRGGRGPRPDATPAEAARLALAEAQARAAISRAQERDPNFRPSPSFTETIEGEIAARQAETREAEAHVRAVDDYHANRPAIERLMPGGREVGERLQGVGENIRTLSREHFRPFVDFVLRDAEEISSYSTYSGRAFRLSDGSILGLRYSRNYGETLDVLESSNRKLIDNDYKVHQK